MPEVSVYRLKLALALGELALISLVLSLERRCKEGIRLLDAAKVPTLLEGTLVWVMKWRHWGVSYCVLPSGVLHESLTVVSRGIEW